MKKYFRKYGSRAKHRPCLLVSRKDISRSAALALDGREPFAVKALAHVSAHACPRVETNAWPKAIQSARETLNAAFLAAFHAAAGQSGQSMVYAKRARRAILAFAELGAPGHDGGLGWLPHNYLITLAFAYDLLWDLGEWTKAEREILERLFYSHLAGLREAMHSKHLSNHGAWPMSRVGTTALLFGDEALARECLEGPDGYTGRLAHEFFDDGMSYEQSAWMYHCFSVEPVMSLALAARGVGVTPDPLRLEVANDTSLDFRGGSTGNYVMPFYPVDTREFPRPRWKDLHLALTAQFGLLRPDTKCPSIGDYGEPAAPMAGHWIPELAWDLYGDKRAARLLAMGERAADGAHLYPPYLLTLAFGRPTRRGHLLPAKSRIYPQAGYGVLNSDETDSYWGSGAVHAVLKFGPYGNGHGHADKLHLDISGGKRKCCIEELDRASVSWRYWNSTVSHNTVVVGGRSQPGDEAMFALNDSCGRLLADRFARDLKFVVAAADDVYEGMRVYRRLVAMAGEYVLDVFEVAARKKTVFDWFLHGMGRLYLRGVKLSPAEFGYRRRGYQFLEDVMSGKTTSPFAARFSAGHKVFFPVAGDVQVFSAVGPWKKNRRRPVLVLRKRGTRACFVAVHDPSGTAVRDVRCDHLDDSCMIIWVATRSGSRELTVRAFEAGAKVSSPSSRLAVEIRHFGANESRSRKT